MRTNPIVKSNPRSHRYEEFSQGGILSTACMAFGNEVIVSRMNFPFNDNVGQDPSLAAGSRTGLDQDALTRGG